MDVNALVKKVTSGAQGNHGTMSTVMGLMGGQNQAGFSNMLSSLNSSGLGDHVKSWVGTGVNQLVSSQQVTNWLGNDKLQQVGRAVGLSPNDVANHLAQQLPAFVDKLTPHGSVPDEAGLENVAGQMSASRGLPTDLARSTGTSSPSTRLSRMASRPPRTAWSCWRARCRSRSAAPGWSPATTTTCGGWRPATCGWRGAGTGAASPGRPSCSAGSGGSCRSRWSWTAAGTTGWRGR